MLTLVVTVLPVFVIIFLGALVERRRFLPDSMATCLNQFVYWIALPALLFDQLASMEPGHLSAEYVWGLLVSSAVCFVVPVPLCLMMFGGSRRKTSITALLGAFPNAAFVGFPVVHLLWPNSAAALPLAAVCAAVMGLVVIVVDLGLVLGLAPAVERGFISACKRFVSIVVHNPLLMATIFGGAYGALGFALPQPVHVATSMLGATAAPCALFCMGMILSTQLRRISGGKHEGIAWHMLVHTTKLVLQPVVTGVCMVLFGITGLPLVVAVVIAGMPTGLVAYVVAERHAVLVDDVSLAIMLNTAFAVFSIPLMMICLRMLQIAE